MGSTLRGSASIGGAMSNLLYRSAAALGVGLLVVAIPARASAQAILALGTLEPRGGTCHTKPTDGRTPDRESLRHRTPEQALDALMIGALDATAEGRHDALQGILPEY